MRRRSTRITVACGVGSILCALVGSVSTCLTGPINAIITASKERSRHYTAGIFTGLLGVAFGLMAPAFTRLMLNAPKASGSAEWQLSGIRSATLKRQIFWRPT